MALNIKDLKTENAVRALARRRDLSLTDAVFLAVSKELDRDELSEEEKERRVAAARARMQALYQKYGIEPSPRTMTREEMDDFLGYDENGLLT